MSDPTSRDEMAPGAGAGSASTVPPAAPAAGADGTARAASIEAATPAAASPGALPRPLLWGLSALGLAALLVSGLLWKRLSDIQEQLARQSADSGAVAVEARTLARQAQELARDTAARQAVSDNKLAEVAMQRAQLEELMQSLTRSRDENLVVDIEAALRLAQQQSQLTLSPEPLLAALRAADYRLARASQPRLARVRAGITRDIDRIKAAAVTDVPSLLLRMDELARSLEEVPVANAVGQGAAAPEAASSASAASTPARSASATRAFSVPRWTISTS